MKNLITYKTVFITALLSLSALQATAQQKPVIFGKTLTTNKNGLVRCATNEYEAYLQAKNPNRETTEQFEQWIAPKIAERKARRSTDAVADVVTIPVVVHIIHNGDAIGKGENISDAQVLSQITVLNQDYRKMADTPGWNDNPVGADMEIQFVLAQTDPDGNLTTGIDRVNLRVTTWNSEDDIEANLKPNTIWDPTKYFNIWVCSFGGSISSLLGYSQFPSSSRLGGLDTDGGDADTDGVVIGYQYFGSKTLYAKGTYDNSETYIYGRTATHEIGHCFGLRHIDGDNTSCTINAKDTYKDYCPDTPAITELHYECTSEDSCPSATGTDMIENYMDYTPDSCMNIFTLDQKGRMLTVLQNSPRRAELLTSTVTQAPTAGLQQNKLLNSINLYPNPVQNVLNIAVSNSQLPDSYTVYNSLGQTVTNAKVSSDASLAINTSAYSNGVYFIKIDKGSQSKTLKFVKN